MLQELQEELRKYQKIFASHVENLKVIFIFWPARLLQTILRVSVKTSVGSKHIRRTAKEITKNQNCPYRGCDKVYGSEGSLNLHMKLKHGAGNKTDREKLSVSLKLSGFAAKLDIESFGDPIWQQEEPSLWDVH